ncbi:MAG: multicopper oxidase family protein, partial [Deltaproteobacteria bacterium]
DHGKPLPVTLPDTLALTFGAFYSGSPFLGGAGVLPPGEGGFNQNSGFFYMWHSHNEVEITAGNLFPGSMLTMLIVEPPNKGVVIPQ